MKTGEIKSLAFWLLLIPAVALAEPAYVIDQIEVGIHAENNIESPILELVGTGTELEVLNKGAEFTEVETLTGVTGWINSAYLMKEKPGAAQAIATAAAADTSLQNELQTAKNQIEELKQQLSASSDESAAAEQIKTMRLKIGELQAELTQLHIKSNDTESNEELYERIAKIEQEKVNLQLVIEEMKNPADDSFKQDVVNLVKGSYNPRHLLYLIIALVLGVILGAVGYDLFNRRRHGGFRI